VDTTTGITIVSSGNSYSDCFTALNGAALYPSTLGPTTISDSSSSYENMAAAGKGGAIYCSGACTFTSSSLSFTNVAAQEGGAVYILDSAIDTMVFDSWVVQGAYATNEGAAIYYKDTDSTATVSMSFTAVATPFRNQFNSCEAGSNGGCLYVDIQDNADITLSMLSTSTNVAVSGASGGFMYLASTGGDITIQVTDFESDSCQATLNGGVFYINTDSDASGTVGTCSYTGQGELEFVDSSAGADGGAFYLGCTGDVTFDIDLATSTSITTTTAGDQGGFIYSTGDDFTFVAKDAEISACGAGGNGGFIYAANTGKGEFSLTSSASNNVD